MAQNGARDYTFGTLFGTTWVILGAILGPAGRQGAPQIKLLGTKSHQNLKKKNIAKREASRTKFFEHFGAIWAILGAIWAPAGRQGAPKINLFATKSHQILKKWVPEWGIKKCMKIWSKFDGKNEDFECAQATELLCIKAFWWLAHIMTKSKN